MKQIFFLFFFGLILACNTTTPIEDNWRIVLKTGRDGSVLSGSKADLMDAIRAGQDLKIGWGVKRKDLSIEHISAPIWLAILSEQEVMVHLDPQVLSTIEWDSLNAHYKNSNLLQQEWRVVLTTKGDFDAIWYDRKADTLVRRWPQKHRMTWFAEGKKPVKPVPFFN
ncbi:MAG: hypothetical protein AAF969_06450 [Bacteroidota bacterium]